MSILVTAKLALKQNAEFVAMATGGIHLLRVSEGALLPNVMLLLIAGGEDYTMQGPDGLSQALVRIYSRAGSDEAALILGSKVVKALKQWTGVAGEYAVQLTEHLNTNADYSDDLKIFRQIDDFRFYYGAK